MINSIDSEYSLIGSLMRMAENRPITELYQHVSKVDDTDFSDSLCRVVYRFIKMSVMNEKPFDELTLHEQILNSYEAPDIKISDIGKFSMLQTSFAAIESHVDKVRDLSMRRKALEVVGKLYEKLQSPDSVQDLLAQAESSIDLLMQRAVGETKEMMHVSDLMMQWAESANAEYMNNEVVKGYTTGFLGTDEVLGETLILPESLVVIGANPGKGKTQLMIKMSTEIAMQYRNRFVDVYSLEMPSQQIIARMIGFATKNTRPKYYTDETWALVGNRIEQLKDTQLYICDKPVMSIERIKSNTRAKIAQGMRPAAIFVDYLTLLQMPKAERRDLSVGEVTKQCKQMAKEFGCIVVLLCQLSRANMQRVNKRPIMSDLKDSGQIEADCDLVLFPYYDFLFNPDSDCGNFAEIIIGKNRHGGSETSYAKVINGVWLDCDQQEARNRLSA